MDGFASTYLLLIFGGCLGVYQIAASTGGFKGLWFFRTAIGTRVGGFLILGATFGWFFGTTNLNMPHEEVEGFQQLYLFLLGSLLALGATFLISSLVNLRRVNGEESSVTGDGLDDLKRATVSGSVLTGLTENGRKPPPLPRASPKTRRTACTPAAAWSFYTAAINLTPIRSASPTGPAVFIPAGDFRGSVKRE